MRRAQRSAPLLASALLAFAGSSTAFASLADQAALAKRFAPVLRLATDRECGPGTAYLPMDIGSLLANPTVALRGPWGGADLVKIAPTGEDLARGLYDYHLDFPGDALDPGCGYVQWARRVTEGRPAVAYAHVATRGGCPGQAGAAVLVLLRLQRLEQPARGRLGDGPAQLRCGERSRRPRTYADEHRLQPARRGRAGEVGRQQAPARGRHPSGPPPGRRIARGLLHLGALPRRLRLAGCRLRRHAGADVRRAPGRRDDSERRDRRAALVSLDRVPGALGRAAARLLQRPDRPESEDAVDGAVPLGDRLARSQRRRARRRCPRHEHDGVLLRRDRPRLEPPPARTRPAAGRAPRARGARSASS